MAKTKTERRVGRPAAVGDLVRAWAQEWGVSTRTVERWRREGAPLDDTPAFAKWANSHERMPPSVMSRLLALGLSSPAKSPDQSEDWKEFEAVEKSGRYQPHRGAEPNASRLCHYYAFRAEKAARLNDGVSEKLYSEIHTRYAQLVRQQQLAADKLGMESGELIQRSEVERIEAARMAVSMVSLGSSIDALATRISELPAMSLQAIRAELEAWLVSGAIVRPYQRMSTATHQLNIPSWYSEAMKREVSQYVAQKDLDAQG